MKRIVRAVKQQGLMDKSQSQIDQLKTDPHNLIQKDGMRLYPRSFYRREEAFYCIAMLDNVKQLYRISETPVNDGLEGAEAKIEGLHVLEAGLTKQNAEALHSLFPFTTPKSLREERTTIGCGDRLGLATAAHLRAVRKFKAFPVLAQQSIRELNFTGRNFEGVVTDASFLVFQEGYEGGWGADGDHLKTIDDIDVALQAKMPMITLDLTAVLHPEAADYSEDKLETEFGKLPQEVREYIVKYYSKRIFNIGEGTISLSESEARKCALMYWDALEFAAKVDTHLRSKRGDQYDLEISIDETTSPTLPAHHMFITMELQRRGVTVNSLAPRFIGDFQKAVDYIGVVDVFERQFRVHCDIAKAHGDYKISIHSGSDKFSVYPVIGKHTRGKLHLKTAGTSWLEALRTISQADPELYRLIHRKAAEYYPEALKSYHITADISVLPKLEDTPDKDLGKFLETSESRQMLHITYGGLLNDPEVRDRFFAALAEHEELHYELLEKHFTKHLERLGLERVQ